MNLLCICGEGGKGREEDSLARQSLLDVCMYKKSSWSCLVSIYSSKCDSQIYLHALYLCSENLVSSKMNIFYDHLE